MFLPDSGTSTSAQLWSPTLLIRDPSDGMAVWELFLERGKSKAVASKYLSTV
jgi:hypothetical protein